MFIRAKPSNARLQLSVPPEVKTISSGLALITSAIVLLDASTAFLLLKTAASQPKPARPKVLPRRGQDRLAFLISVYAWFLYIKTKK